MESVYSQRCVVPACLKPPRTQSMCTTHYKRDRRHGSPFWIKQPKNLTTAQRLQLRSRVDPLTGCVLWQGPPNPDGYGIIYEGGRCQRVHRLAWLEAHGSIPEGMEIDHLCEVRACFNIKHLELVTHAENMYRRFNRPEDKRIAGISY